MSKMQISRYFIINSQTPFNIYLLKKSLTKLKKLKASSKKQIPWNVGYFNITTPDMSQ